MKLCTQIVLLVVAVSAGLIYRQYQILSGPKALPEFDLDAYWGPGEKPAQPSEKRDPKLSQLHAPTHKIEDLKYLLDRRLKLQPPLEGTGYEYGVNSGTLKEILSYWREYMERWLSREIFFNRMPHYLLEVQGLRLHYIHTIANYNVRNKTIYPLLLLHGWPGSIREFYEIIPKLALPDSEELDVVFEVVAPSLPGYGWSQAASKPGFGIAEMAVVLRNLMIQLGYDKFFIQGGDWGSLLGSNIATMFPDNVLGYHSNMCVVNTPIANIKSMIASFYPSAFVTKEQESFHFPLSKYFTNTIYEMGYAHLQATKPDTIGIALHSNPIGLAVYILEKFSTWTNPQNRELADGGWSTYDEDFKDAILDNIMVYFLTKSITSSVRLYSETMNWKQMAYGLDQVPTNVPTACARFKHDLGHSMDWQLKDKFTNLIQSTYYDVGGHFAALEQPDLLFQDFAKFVKKVLK